MSRKKIKKIEKERRTQVKKPLEIRVTNDLERGMVTIHFGNAFKFETNQIFAQNLAALIKSKADELPNVELDRSTFTAADESTVSDSVTVNDEIPTG